MIGTIGSKLTSVGGSLANVIRGKGSSTYKTSSLPAYTIRVRLKEGKDPTSDWTSGQGIGYRPSKFDSYTQVEPQKNIWDYVYTGNDWSWIFQGWSGIQEVLDANIPNVTTLNHAFASTDIVNVRNLYTRDVTDCDSMFLYCTSLTHVALFDTSKCTIFTSMFGACESLTSTPSYDTRNGVDFQNFFNSAKIIDPPSLNLDNCTNCARMFRYCGFLKRVPLYNLQKSMNCNEMFENCYNVEKGALALYNELSSRPDVSMIFHNSTFRRCGRDTVLGAAELAQIPSAWK